MARAGDTIENPLSGQCLIFRTTTQDSDGDFLEVESVYTKPTPSRPPVHYHPNQEERFEVLSGPLHVEVDGEERILDAGEVITIPPGTPHEMSASEAGVRVNWQTRPALGTEAFFEAMWGLAHNGKTNEKGVPNILQTAVLMAAYDREFRLVSPPRFVQKVVFGALAPIGRLLGYRADYPYPYMKERSRQADKASG